MIYRSKILALKNGRNKHSYQNKILLFFSLQALPSKAITLEELERSLIQQTSNESSDDDDDNDDLPNTGESFEAFAQRVGTALTPKQAQRITELVPKNMISFKFNDYILTAGQSPILVCTVCGNEGHLQVKFWIFRRAWRLKSSATPITYHTGSIVS